MLFAYQIFYIILHVHTISCNISFENFKYIEEIYSTAEVYL